MLNELKRLEEALASFDRALALEPHSAIAFYNRGNALGALKRFDEALASYERAIALEPDHADTFNNKGNVLNELKRFGEALASYDRAIALKPDYADAFNNRGIALVHLKRLEEALASYDKAIALKPDYADAFNNRGIALGELKRLDEALASYEQAIALKPGLQFLHGDLALTRLKLCAWGELETEIADLAARIGRGEKVASPGPVLALTDSLELQRKAAEIWVQARHPPKDALPAIAKRPRRDKIRIGYFSADFRDHPVAQLTAGLFEAHDRSRFEVTAFSFGPDEKDEVYQRLSRAFDDFIDVRAMSDRDVAILARSREIDIAVDLTGFTQDARTGIFALRAAPMQVSYLGYPGTMAATYIDYLIADPILIPASHQRNYAEKIVYLPNSYQANDGKRRISDRVFSRAEAGLPPAGFVFCCFNNNYKIMPDIFDCWMRILARVDGSVLWLSEANATAAGNLRKEAIRRGVEADRLVFAPRLPLPEHLARQRLADLFLDTLPYNAQTTASDALWAGLPVLTRIGETFTGRVAASLLKAIGLPELITSTSQDYEALAVALATDPARLASIKRKLAGNRLTTPLFDTRLFTKHIEAAYTAMHERYQADLPPGQIHVPSIATSWRDRVKRGSGRWMPPPSSAAPFSSTTTRIPRRRSGFAGRS